MADTVVETPQLSQATNDKMDIAAEEAEAAAMTDKEMQDLKAKADSDTKETDEAEKPKDDSANNGRRTLKSSDALNFVTSLGKRMTLGRKTDKKADKSAAEDETESKEDEKKTKSADSPKLCKEVVPPPPVVHKKDYKTDVVYLYQFGRTPVLPSISPFCLKTETYLKLVGIPYENVDHQSKLRSKRGLLPFVELNGEEINESDYIIETLGNKFDKSLDTGISASDKNVQHAMITMVDSHLNWCYTHWSVRDVNNTIRGYKVNLQDMMHSVVPNSVLAFAMKFTYIRRTQKRLKAAGFGYYSDAEVDAMGEKDLSVLSELLGDKDYFFGAEPRTLDLKVFVWLAIILSVDKEVPFQLRDFMNVSCTNLVGLFNRIKDRAWGEDWAKATGDCLELNPHIPKPVEPEPEPEKAKEAEDEKKADEKPVESEAKEEVKEEA